MIRRREKSPKINWVFRKVFWKLRGLQGVLKEYIEVILSFKDVLFPKQLKMTVDANFVGVLEDLVS